MSPHRTPRAVPSGPRPLRRTVRVAVAGLVLPAALLAGSTGLPASSAQAPAASSTPQRVAAAGNPLAGHRWGVYKGAADQSWPPYARSTGTNRALLAKIALRPKAKWFGHWIPNGADHRQGPRLHRRTRTAGDPDALVQMTMFRMVPWEHEACRRLPDRRRAGQLHAVGRPGRGRDRRRPRGAVLQPDGPFALCAPRGSTLPSRLVAYAARTFSALPQHQRLHRRRRLGLAARTTRRRPRSSCAGRHQVRARLRAELHALRLHRRRGRLRDPLVVRARGARGTPGKHFVINTSSNGHAFDFGSRAGRTRTTRRSARPGPSGCA